MNEGAVYAIGLGPGDPELLAPKAREAILKSTVVAGYSRYIQRMPQALLECRRVISTGMTKETERCREALREAVSGERVAMVSSGDPGVYGMAGLLLELVNSEPDFKDVRIETIPGITAASAAAASLGAPLMNDFAVISLSDLLTPHELILKRLVAVAAADMVCAIYNPKSKSRTQLLDKAIEIFMAARGASTCFGIVKSASCQDEFKACGTLGSFPKDIVDMSTIVIVGCSKTEILGGRLITRRGYLQAAD